MKIQKIQNPQYNMSYTGATVPHYRINNDITDSNNNKPKRNNNIPEWMRKGTLAVLLFFTVKNDPSVQNFLTPDNVQREQKAKTEFLENVSKFGQEDDLTPAMYHINRLVDVDNAKIKSKGRDSYEMYINFDKEKISSVISLTPLSNNAIAGTFKTENGGTTRYKAIFSKENPDVFEIHIRNQNNNKYIFGRTPKGEFYRIDGNKKVILNRKNVENYQKSLENIPDFENLQDVKFFTTQNDMWRKLNLILLALLLFNEMSHDNRRRKEKNQKD